MPKRKKKKQATTSITIRQPSTQEIIGPLEEGGKYSLIPTLLKQTQQLAIFGQTPKERIKTRPAKGGGVWSYVDGWYVKKVLNYIFGFLWDFEVVDKGREGNFVWVQGRLTVKHPTSLKPMIVKTQFGGVEIKYRKGTKDLLDYPNDLKAATTDALKKCAADLGIANDVYAPNEAHEEAPPGAAVTPPPPPAKPSTEDQKVQIVIAQVNRASAKALVMIRGKIAEAKDISDMARQFIMDAIDDREKELKK